MMINGNLLYQIITITIKQDIINVQILHVKEELYF